MSITAGAPDGRIGSDLSGWIPMQLRRSAAELLVRWVYVEGLDFTDPFFEQTIERALADPFRLLFWRETTMDQLLWWAHTEPGLEPAGLVFHASRCGSTLVARSFAADERTLVLSEPGPLDQLLRAGVEQRLEEGRLVGLARAMVSALAQPRRPGQTRVVVKLDASSVLHWRLLRLSFPEIPAVFLYRQPGEILVSQLDRLSHQMMPAARPPEALVGLPAEAAEAEREAAGLRMWAMAVQRPEWYCASVIKAYLQAGLDAAQAGAAELVHYDELPVAVTTKVAPAFGVDLQSEVVAAVAGRHAKEPDRRWEPDWEAKQARLTPELAGLVDAVAGPVYRELEARRQSMG